MNFSTPISIIPICTNAMEMFAWPKQITFKSFYISRGSPLGSCLVNNLIIGGPEKNIDESIRLYLLFAFLHVFFYPSILTHDCHLESFLDLRGIVNLCLDENIQPLIFAQLSIRLLAHLNHLVCWLFFFRNEIWSSKYHI